MHELLGDLLLEVKLRVKLLQVVVLTLEILACVGLGLAVAGVRDIKLREVGAVIFELLAQLRQCLQISLTAFDLLVEDHAVETFAAFHEFLREVEVGAGDETEAVEMALHARFRVLDALGDFDLLLTRQQRHLAHLLEVHAHRVVEDIEPTGRLAFFVVGFFFLFVVLVVVAFGVRVLFFLEVFVTRPRPTLR